MELNFSEEDLKEIILVSYHYFYNPGDPRKYSTELSKYYHEFRNYTMLSSYDNNSYEHIF